MLRIVQNNHASAAKRYFNDGLAQGDYYVPGEDGKADEPGRWGGLGAERLGLRGVVDREAFNRLCENWLPDGSGQLTARTRSNRRVGYDINFHCPKSVSVVHALTGDPAILDAIRTAVHETMSLIEADSHVRVRVGNGNGNRVSGNLIWAEFVHKTTRPVQGIPDPHLHAHCFTFNATFDPVENRWKAVELGYVKKYAGFYEAAFLNRLAGLLAEQGYGVTPNGRFWELEGVPATVIRKFSRRTAEIENTAARRGITDPARKSELGARTRRSKAESRPWEEVKADWQRRFTADEREACGRAKASNGDSSRQKDSKQADKEQPKDSPDPSLESNGRATRKALDAALAHSFERASVVSEKRLLETASRFAVGKVTLEQLKAGLDRPDLIRREVDGKTFFTTAAVLREEQAMLAFARDGRGTCRPLNRNVQELISKGLTPVQHAAGLYVLHSRDRVILVRGVAGSGKMPVMKAAIEKIQAGGHRVMLLTPSASLAKGALLEAGFKEANTVSRFIRNEELQAKAKNGVLWIDEAGLLGTRTLAEVFRVADKHNTRVILSGDTRQHASVERGDALRLLETHAGLRSAQIQKVREQRGEYREAVAAFSRGDTARAFGKLDSLGAIHEIKNEDARYAAVASDYLNALRKQKSALIVSPTRAEGERVTSAVREQLKAAKRIQKREHEVETLKSLGLSQFERSQSASYRSGLVIEFHQNAKGFKAGSRYEVLGKDPFGHVLARKGLWVEALPLKQSDRFEVFERSTIKLARGDQIRVTRNGHAKSEAFGLEKLLSPRTQYKSFNMPIAKALGIKRPNRQHRVTNGGVYQVAGFTLGGDIKLQNGFVLSKDYAHLTYGYCLSSPASQGRTVDHVIVAQNTEPTKAASTEQFYVSASRGKESVSVFTDDKAALLEAVKRQGRRESATELLERDSEHEPHVVITPESEQRESDHDRSYER